MQLTNSQQLIWFGQSMLPEVPLYNMAWRFDLSFALSPTHFEKAFQALVDRTDALRLVFQSVDGVAQQRILPSLSGDLPLVDFCGMDQPADRAREWIAEAVGRKLDLDRKPYESALLKLTDEHWIWYLNLHHLVTDAWSVALLYARMNELYGLAREDRLGDAPEYPHYLDHVARQSAARDTAGFSEAQRYWEERATAPHGRVRLYGKKGDKRATANTRFAVPFGASRSQRLNRLADTDPFRSLSVDLTRFNLLATAVFAFLHRVSGQEAITIGAPIHNRSSLALRETAGLFIEMFPLTVTIGENDSFLDLFRRVAAETQNLLRNAQAGSSNPALSRQYNVVLNHIHVSFEEFEGRPVLPTWIHPGHVDPGHDLRIQIHDLAGEGRYLAQFDCSDSVFSPSTRKLATRHFVHLLDAMIDQPGQPVGQVPLGDESDREYWLKRYNRGTQTSVPFISVLDRFRQQTASNPDAPAVRLGDEVLSYRALDRQSDRVADNLRSRGAEADLPVGVCMTRGTELLVAILGILKAGGAFVPLDPRLPPRRLEYILDDADIGLVLVNGDIAPKPQGIRADWVPIGRLTASSAPDIRMPAVPVDAMHLAYVIYTSGSSGFPKGVMVEHGPLAAYSDWAHRTFAEGKRSDFPLFSAIGFDLTITSLFVPLISGACVHVYPESGTSSDLAVLQVFEDDAVDVVKLTPAHLALVLEQSRPLARIRSLVLGGENLRTDLALRAHRELGAPAIYNEYGPTEAVVGCMVHRFDPATDTDHTVPIGVPASHHRIYVLDGAGNPQAAGIAGELYVAGNLARGYVKRDDLNAARFLPDPFHPGERMYRTGDLARLTPSQRLQCLGRSDEQVKLGSVRIEPEEIQRALLAFDGIRDCVIDVHQGRRRQPAQEVQHCTRCGLSSAYPGVSFDTEGVCQLCTGFEQYRDRAEVYFADIGQLIALLEDAKRRATGDYDCIALLSGGKDSTYALYRVAELGPRILAITLDNGYISEGAKQNIRKVVGSLGIDHRFVSTPAMNAIFADSLERHSNVCNGCFKTIYTLAMRIALDEGIPYIVTGLSRGQFFETRLTPDLFLDTGTTSVSIDHTVLEARKAYHRVDDAVSRLLDVAMFDDEQVFDKVGFIDFYRYCDVGLDEVYRFLDQHAPWIRPADTGRSTNCLINDAGIYVHKRKEGFHNYALPYSWDVRIGHKTRDAALQELDDRIDPRRVQQILDEIGYHEENVVHGSAGSRLVAYCVADGALDSEALRGHLAEYLPEAMIPAHFVPIDRMPLTDNGKIDRSALPEPTPGRPSITAIYHAPVTPMQRQLAELWKSVLDIRRVGLQDNYYALGGDSISAIQIAARARSLGLALAATDIFERQTLASLAAYLEEKAAHGAEETRSDDAKSDDPARFSMANLDADKLGKLEQLLNKGRGTERDGPG